MTKKEKQFIEAIKLLGFQPSYNFYDFSNGNLLKCCEFDLPENPDIELCIEDHTVEELVKAIFEAGIKIGKKQKSTEIQNCTASFLNSIGLKPLG